MTKKDYELIAGVFRTARECNADIGGPLFEPELLEVAIADALAEDNPRFQRDRFLAACRGEDAKDSAGRKVSYASR